MSPSRTIGIILGWTALGVALGAVVALLLPKQYVSVAELAVESDALAWAGLARFDRLNIADGVEVETLVQLLKSARLSNATAAQVGGVSRYEIEKSLKVVYEKSSPVVTLKVTSGAPAQAQAIGRVLIENVVKIDGEKKQQRSREAIEAVKAQTAEVERQLGALNGEIQKFAATRTVALSNDPERQRRAATELAYLTEKLAMLNVEGATLRERGRRLAELMAALPAVSAAPPGFAVEEADKSPGLAEARTRLLAQESELASLRSRYGARHAKVVAVEAEVAATRKSLRDLLNTQREVVQAQIDDNANAQKFIEQKIAATEAETKQSDLSLDPAFAALLARRDALVANYRQLTTRQTELGVFAGARPFTFYVFSEPTFPDRTSVLRSAAVLAAGLLLGVVLAFCHCLLRWGRPSPAPHAVSRPAYAEP